MSELVETVGRMLAVPVSDERPWVVFAACRDVDPDIFFPASRKDVDQALAICASCPVCSECLDYAIETGERFGVWGGLTEKERRKLLFRQRRPA